MAKVKGTNVRGAVKLLRASREQALAALPHRLHHYLSDRILVSSWYPEEDLLELLRAASTLMSPKPDPWSMLGYATARNDLADIYQNNLWPDDPERTLGSATALWRNYHDTGVMTAAIDGPRTATVRLRGYEAPTREMCWVVRGYIGGLVAFAGATRVEVTKLQCCLDGAEDCRWRLEWS